MKVKRFLIIDDDDDVRAYYKAIIDEHYTAPHEITEFSTATESIQFLKENKTDLILLDYQLADTNGINLLKYLKKISGKFTPIVMLTGKGNENIAVTAIKNGASDYLVKSEITAEKLLKVIEDVFKQAEIKKYTHLKRKRYRQHMHYDNQTGFINKKTFERIAEDVLKKSIKHNKSVAIILVHIEQSMPANEIPSEILTEEIIKKIAISLTNFLPKNSVISRYGVDEFAIMLAGYNTMTNLITVANKILSKIRVVHLKNNSMQIKASLGIGCYPDYNNIILLNNFTRFFSQKNIKAELDEMNEDGVEQLVSLYSAKLCEDKSNTENLTMSINDLLNNCRTALNRAIKKGGDCFDIYRKNNYSKVHRDLEIELALHECINQGYRDFFIEFEPISLLRHKKYIGFEINIGWKDARLGEITREEFLPTAKRINIINHLDNFILQSATNSFFDLTNLHENQINRCHVTLGLDFTLLKMNDSELLDQLFNFIEIAKPYAHHIELQINEETFRDLIISTKDANIIGKIISFQLIVNSPILHNELINKLCVIPISSIKISSGLVQKMLKDKHSSISVCSIIRLGKELNINVIADGIDAADQYDFLLQNGCSIGMGKYLGSTFTPAHLRDFVGSARIWETS